MMLGSQLTVVVFNVKFSTHYEQLRTPVAYMYEQAEQENGQGSHRYPRRLCKTTIIAVYPKSEQLRLVEVVVSQILVSALRENSGLHTSQTTLYNE